MPINFKPGNTPVGVWLTGGRGRLDTSGTYHCFSRKKRFPVGGVMVMELVPPTLLMV